MSLPFYGLTVILGFYQGIIIALWYSESKEQNARFLLKNVLEYKITEYFDEPYDNWSNVAPVFHVPQIINPLEWTAQLGLKRPTVSGLGDEYELAGLGHLYQRTRRYSKTKQWHHWDLSVGAAKSLGDKPTARSCMILGTKHSWSSWSTGTSMIPWDDQTSSMYHAQRVSSADPGVLLLRHCCTSRPRETKAEGLVIHLISRITHL
uniref:Uncharacterized protein n=1 Tax=Fusarium oxysporum (strain Fo5176) TaxID=660025 RepID=A0A0C4DJG5_FUSOF